MLKACSVCTKTSPMSYAKKATDLPFHTCHFQILRTWPKHSSNLICSDCLQVQGQTDKIERKILIPPHTARKICYISFKEVCQLCYRAYYQIVIKSIVFIIQRRQQHVSGQETISVFSGLGLFFFCLATEDIDRCLHKKLQNSKHKLGSQLRYQ